MATKTKHLGECQICEGRFKLRDGKMVHHGYKRPGVGYIVGDCWGVDQLPYELSCERVGVYLESINRWLSDTRGLLERLKSGAAESLVVDRYNTKVGRFEPRTILKSETMEHEWNRQLESSVRRAENRIHDIEQDVVRLTKRIAIWVLRPVQEVNEEQQASMDKAAREARAAVVAEKRRIRQAEVAAIEAKRVAREKKRAATIAEYATKITTLAVSPESADQVRRCALETACKYLKTKVPGGPLYLWELKCDEDLIKLGLAEKANGGLARYLIRY